MSDRYSHDKLAQEKGELSELSSVKYVGVPLFLLAVFLGFGVTYQVLRTPSMELGGGDSRTSGAKVIAAVSASANQADLRLVNGKRLYAATCQACHQANGMDYRLCSLRLTARNGFSETNGDYPQSYCMGSPVRLRLREVITLVRCRPSKLNSTTKKSRVL